VLHFHAFTTAEFQWTLKATLGEYSASPGCTRFFCRECGSFLVWQGGEVEDFEVTVGTIDEKWLIGQSGFGKELADPNGDHFYVENEILGVTDSNLGTKFLQGSAGGPLR
jgi:hypothetical protein